LFASTRELEVSCLPGDAARALFLDSQFNAQLESYRRSFPQANHDIIELDGVAAGRLYVDRAPMVLQLIDISLLPEYRARGIGTALLQALLAEAAQRRGTVRLSVATSNPAQRLYQRLGFRTISADAMYRIQVAGGNE
jgi:ribosomal protein S18 acetylase RimI-like enzyme